MKQRLGARPDDAPVCMNYSTDRAGAIHPLRPIQAALRIGQYARGWLVGAKWLGGMTAAMR